MDSPIDTLVVTLRAHDFRGEVVGRATKSPSNIRDLLRKPEIGNLEVPVSVEQQVLRFEVTVNDVHAVEVVQGQSDLGSVKLRYWVGKALVLFVSTSFVVFH
jgi:hypothetical protein